jgi:hypothetical protein
MYVINALSYHTYNIVLHGLLEVYSVNLFPFLVIVFHYDSTSGGKVWYFFLGIVSTSPSILIISTTSMSSTIISFIIKRGSIHFREWCRVGRARLVVF